MATVDDAGRTIAGLIGYNPGPGIYSRLERAVEAMPETVRVQELPGLLKRYKDGVPGWELKATDLDATIAGRDVVPRSELLAAVKERSPVYTHKEIVLGGTPQQSFQPEYYTGERPSLEGQMIADFQRQPSPLGQGVSHGVARYGDYGQGGENYSELLMLQPNALGEQFASHWHGQSGAPGARAAVAHARYDTHGDALRINELQSDLGIHNRKIREQAAAARSDEMEYIGRDAETIAAKDRRQTDASYIEKMRELGFDVAKRDDGGWVVRALAAGKPFPMEDAWADVLIKRMALEAARMGHRAIEVASPRAIADKVGGNIDNYEHFYGKVVPGALERLGRKMGGLTEEQVRLAPESAPAPHYGESARRMEFRTTDALNDAITLAHGWVGRQRGQRSVGDPFEEMVDAMSLSNDYREQAAVMSHAQEVHDRMVRTAIDNGYPEEAAKTLVARAMPGVMRDAENVTALRHARARLAALAMESPPPAATPATAGRRYIMSDEMRRRLIEGGVGAAVGTGIMSQDDLIERLNQ